MTVDSSQQTELRGLDLLDRQMVVVKTSDVARASSVCRAVAFVEPEVFYHGRDDNSAIALCQKIGHDARHVAAS